MRTRAAIAVIVATLDTKPLNKPAGSDSMRSPDYRAAKCPVLPVTMTAGTAGQNVARSRR